jgi:hypothetical protein
MLITLEMGPEFESTVRELGAMGAAVREACSAGLAKGVKLASTRVIRDYISGQSLKRRSGNMARAIDGWLDAPLDGVVGVRDASAVAKYSWLLGDEERTITPQNAKFLTIPIGEGLTGSGVARYSSPRQVPDGFFINKGGKLLFGYKNGKKGKFRPLFVLVKSVLVQGSGALYDGVMDSVDDITEEINKEIDRRVGAA